MDPIEALKIARHHLGDTVHRCYCGGAHADVWYVEAVYQGEYHLGCAPTPDAAAVAVATQLRVAGWVPSHARLVWHSSKWHHHLRLHMDNYMVDVLFAARFQDDVWSVFDRTLATDDDRILRRATKDEAAATIAAWHAATLPSLHLPPFPGDKL